MPKQKTKSSAKKRFKLTGTGKIKRKHAFKSHILTKKSKKRKYRMCSIGRVDPTVCPRTDYPCKDEYGICRDRNGQTLSGNRDRIPLLQRMVGQSIFENIKPGKPIIPFMKSHTNL